MSSAQKSLRGCLMFSSEEFRKEINSFIVFIYYD